MIQPPKGTRDISQEEFVKFQFVKDTLRKVFERYGFQGLETPAFESFELFTAKGGLGEAVKDEIYYFKDKGDRELGLRFDLTMPLSRFIMNNPDLPKPFKRYQIGRVWRYDNPQAMRWREFWQADVDIIGSSSMDADVQCIGVAVECLNELGFKKFFIRLNSRKLIEYILKKLGVTDDKIKDSFRIIDKMDKIGLDQVKKDLKAEGIKIKIDDLFVKGTNSEVLKNVEKTFGKNEGLDELKEILKSCKSLGIDKYVNLDLSLVRGLGYYTGPVFEVSIESAGVSCGGGGRYDGLIGNIGGKDTPAVGISFGVDRLVSILKKKSPKKAYFVAFVNEKVKDEAFGVCQMLRKAGFNADIGIMDRNLSKQMKYASAMNYPFVIVVGEKELEKKSITLRDMETGKEKLIKIKDLGKIDKI